MNSGKIMDGFYHLCQWIVKFSYLNILWFLFTILGFGIFGAFPATTAMFSVTRKWVTGDPDVPIFRLFWNTYKTEFLKSNLIGLIFVIIGFIVYVDFVFIEFVDNAYVDLLFYPLFVLTLVYTLTMLFTFPVYVHYDNTIIKTIKNAFFIIIINPLSSVLTLLVLITLFFFNVSFPAFIPFVSVNVLSWVIMFFANHAFNKIERKKDEATNLS